MADSTVGGYRESVINVYAAKGLAYSLFIASDDVTNKFAWYLMAYTLICAVLRSYSSKPSSEEGMCIDSCWPTLKKLPSNFIAYLFGLCAIENAPKKEKKGGERDEKRS